MALTQRASSNSLRSLASNSSSASSVSLQRTNRTTRKSARSRSRTVTSSDPPVAPTELLPAQPGESSHRRQSAEQSRAPSFPIDPSHSQDSDDEGSIIAYLSNEDSGVPITPKASSPTPAPYTAETPMGMPRKASFAARRAGLTEIDVVRANARDSMTTQQSYTTHQTSGTSYYPRSSTTGTVDSLLTPSTSRSFEPEIHESPELDTDDVSYRLRLLVNNNYFLPPAHAKPQLSDLAHTAPEVQKKSSLPFLDIFKINKSKSKPTTPTAPHHSPDGQPPILRTTSDSTSSPAPARPAAASSIQNSSVGFLDRAPRVVVIKEKVEDIVQAAKKVEEEYNLKDVFERQSQAGTRPLIDVIDPTDSVDLPPPSSEYPFAVQTSALHGLGVNESLGAALLADRLLPSTQHLGTLVKSEEDWRRALLQDAVSLSLHSVNLSGSFSSPISSSPVPNATPTPLRSYTSPPASLHSLSSSSKQLKAPASVKARLEQRIINNPVIDSPCASPPPMSHDPRRDRANTVSMQSFNHPLRAETPLTPHTPLAPAPRPPVRYPQTLAAIGMSSSRSVNGESPQHSLSDNNKSIRKVTSTPMLHDSHESRMTFMMTPPPGELTRDSLQSAARSLHSAEVAAAEKASFYLARPSVTLSTAEDLYASDHSRQSAAASAFFDALTHLPNPSTQNFDSRSTLGYQTAKTSDRNSPVAMFDTLSPPTRTASPTSFRSASPGGRRLPSPLALDPRLGQSFLSLGSEPSVEIMEPEPTTPPLPVALHKEHASRRRKGSAPVPGPSSPPSFFDTLQSQPNAIDDLDSSSDDEELSTSTPFSRSNAGSFMRLGNYSTPHVSRPANIEKDPIPSLPSGHLHRRTSDSKKPVGFNAPRAPFFTQVKDQLRDAPTTMLPFGLNREDHKQQRRPHTSAGTTSTRQGSGDGSGAFDPQYRLRQQKSLKRLDGLLLKHMESEKDTIRRITNTARTDQNKR